MGILFFFIKTALVALLMYRVVTYVMRRRARAAHRLALLELQKLAEQSGLEIIRGKLVVEGHGLAPDQGRPISNTHLPTIPLAARTHWASRDRLWLKKQQPWTVDRAEALYLDTAKGRVRVNGDVKIESGSALVALGTPAPIDKSTWYDLETTVVDGDEVSMLGKFRREATETMTEGEYREAPESLVIEPIEKTGYLHLVAVAPPKVHPKLEALIRRPLVVLVVILSAFWGNSFASELEDRLAGRDAVCRTSGLCHVDSRVRWEGASGLMDLLHGSYLTVRAHEKADCLRSRGCLERGECSVVNGECKVDTDEDCRSSVQCSASGNCAARAGVCVAGNDTDCVRSGFYAFGEGSAVDGRCMVGKDADCQRTALCELSGACTANQYGQCVVGKADDCMRSRNCRLNHQFCTFSDGTCIEAKLTDAVCQKRPECAQFDRCFAGPWGCDLPDSHCAGSDACRIFGLCRDDCKARSAQDCAASKRCKTDGACKVIQGECASSCATSDQCQKTGACSESKDGCVITSDADCRQSERCKSAGLCSFLNGQCVRSDNDCKTSEGCKISGECFATDPPGYSCTARDSASCRASEECRDAGKCTVSGSSCELTSSDDCALTSRCEIFGKCELVGDRCQVSDAVCKRLPGCKERGECSAATERGSLECEPLTDAECQASAVCQRYGWCTPVKGYCFIP